MYHFIEYWYKNHIVHKSWLFTKETYHHENTTFHTKECVPLWLKTSPTNRRKGRLTSNTEDIDKDPNLNEHLRYLSRWSKNKKCNTIVTEVSFFKVNTYENFSSNYSGKKIGGLCTKELTVRILVKDSRWEVGKHSFLWYLFTLDIWQTRG